MQKPLSTVLFVEDDSTLRETLKLAFRFRGHLAFGARNLGEARRVLATIQVTLIVSDVTLPDGMGFELAALDTPMVFFTGERAESICGWPAVQKASEGAIDRLEEYLIQASHGELKRKPLA